MLTVSPSLTFAAEAALPLTLTEQQVLFNETPSPTVTEKLLTERIKVLESRPVITLEELNRKRMQRLQEMADSVKTQRESMVEFQGYVNWMGNTLSGYSKYVEAGSFAAGFARMLPIPYSGQAGQLTKFVSHFALSLSETSVAINKYLASSAHFITGVNTLGFSNPDSDQPFAELTFYADQQLATDMTEVQARLTSTSELSGSALSFLVSLQQYLANTDEYWQKTKSLVSRNDHDKSDKGTLAGSIDGLKARAEKFNGRLKRYDESVGKTLPQIASLVAFDELRQGMASKIKVGDQLDPDVKK